MSYAKIINFGNQQNSPKNLRRISQNNPLSYCSVTGLDSGFYHTIGGGNQLLGPNSTACQSYLGQYCSNNWDDICENLSKNNSPGLIPNSKGSINFLNDITQGQILIRNAAAEKYIVAMSNNCYKELQPFDPTVADSPMISSWKSKAGSFSKVCVAIYDCDHKNIDNDIIMNKLLEQPWIAPDILGGIFKTKKRNGTLNLLEGTKLMDFFKKNNLIS